MPISIQILVFKRIIESISMRARILFSFLLPITFYSFTSIEVVILDICIQTNILHYSQQYVFIFEKKNRQKKIHIEQKIVDQTRKKWGLSRSWQWLKKKKRAFVEYETISWKYRPYMDCLHQQSIRSFSFWILTLKFSLQPKLRVNTQCSTLSIRLN